MADIQAASAEAARWDVAGYLAYDFRVALCGPRVAGFLVSRTIAGEECEVLNLAVAPEFRRQGVARGLLKALLATVQGVVFLEVRESNTGAREFYKSVGFQEVNTRKGYYEAPPEAAIVMKFHSC
ncbi:MAG: ribosomal protein S18-alanine N-acetyltransferase [Acidobacteriia bacterium]|nr:ribosomal protein S18-alanine N-acetyltransferase [Terriglobia bacterium]